MTRVQQIADCLLRSFEPDVCETDDNYIGDLPDGYTFTCSVSVNPVWNVREGNSIDEWGHSEYSHTLWYVENLKIFAPDAPDDQFSTFSDEQHEKLIKYLQS